MGVETELNIGVVVLIADTSQNIMIIMTRLYQIVSKNSY